MRWGKGAEAVVQVRDCAFGYSAPGLLRAVSFQVRAGAFVSITGCNGAGKTTLLRLLLGELTPQAGEIKVFGLPVRKVRDWARVGYLPQMAARTASFPATASEIVSTGIYGGPLWPRFSGKERKAKVSAALEAVGMETSAGTLIGNLSCGQLQRVLIARALVGDPELLLLDEPTAGVDTQAADSLYRLLGAFCRERGVAVMMVTHDVAGASKYVDQCFCLRDGAMTLCPGEAEPC